MDISNKCPSGDGSFLVYLVDTSLLTVFWWKHVETLQPWVLEPGSNWEILNAMGAHCVENTAWGKLSGRKIEGKDGQERRFWRLCEYQSWF